MSKKFLFVNTNSTKCFTILNNELEELEEFDTSHGFNFEDIKTLKDLTILKYLKLLTIIDSDLKSIKFLSDKAIDTCILINLTNINVNNITLNNEYKFLVSNDLLSWDVYYDDSTFNTIKVDKYNVDILKKYILEKSKPLNYINKKYNYILILLDKPIRYIYKSTNVNKKLSNDNITITEDDYLITAKNAINKVDVDIDIINPSDIPIDSLEEFK